MENKNKLVILIAAAVVAIGSTQVYAAPEKSASSTSTGQQEKVRYRKAKDVSFDEMLINGQLQRPEIAVVTGESAQGTDGLLRLRENFIDQVAIDFGEVAQ